MNTYLVLYRSEAALRGMTVSEMFAKSTPEQMEAGMAAWRAWHEQCGNAVVDLGAPLDKSTTVKPDSSAPAKTTITGYTLLQAASMEAAVSLIKGHPHFYAPGATVQILECIHMPGM
jgi:hypothetical protein